MIVRKGNSSDRVALSGSVIVISQPTHSWISGEIGKSWGNSSFQLVNPLPELVLGAALHDIGFCDWERRPKINPATKLPYSFVDMPHADHLQLWEKGFEILRHISGFAALFQSLHASHLYHKLGIGRTAKDRQMTEEFLRHSLTKQNDLFERLQNNQEYDPILDPETIFYFRDLVAAWDGISLELCGGMEKATFISEIPLSPGKKIDLHLNPLTPEKIRVDPWPFNSEKVSLSWDFRVLQSQYSDQTDFDEAWLTAPAGRKKLELCPS